MLISSPLLRFVCEVLQLCSRNCSYRAACFSFHRMSIWRRLQHSHLRGGLTVHLILTLFRLPSLAKGASLRTTFWPRFWTAWPSPALSQREVHLTEPAISLMRYGTAVLHFSCGYPRCPDSLWAVILTLKWTTVLQESDRRWAWPPNPLIVTYYGFLVLFFVYGFLAGGLRRWQF